MVVCLERGADLHMAQLMPLPLTVSCFSKIQIGFSFLVPAHPGSPRKRPVKRVCVCVGGLNNVHISSRVNCVHETLYLYYVIGRVKVKVNFAFSAVTLLVGHQEEHPACKNRVMRCWCRYLSGVRCRLFAYGPADATAVPKPGHLFAHLNPDWFYFSSPGLPRLSWKRGH